VTCEAGEGRCGREGEREKMFEGVGRHGREEGRWEKKDVKDLAMCAIWMCMVVVQGVGRLHEWHVIVYVYV